MSLVITVTVNRPGGTDPFGNPLPGSTHTITNCWWAPRASEERTDGQATVITGRSLKVPRGADLNSQDRILFPGETDEWQVDGDISDYESPFTGWNPGMLLTLRRVNG